LQSKWRGCRPGAAASMSSGGNRFVRNDGSRSPERPGDGSTLVCIAECPEFGLIMCLGKASRACDHADCAAAQAAVLFFYTVNQVLVRLWARVIDIDPWLQDRGWCRSRCSAELSDRERLLAGSNGNIRPENGRPTAGGEGSEAL